MKSIESQIDKFKSKIRALVDDFRCQSVGGLNVGLMIWDMAVLPFILYNSET